MKDILGFEGEYAVDEAGSVWSYRKNDWLKPGINSSGYYHVILYKNKIKKAHYVHRLLAQAYLEKYSKDLHIDHIDGDRLNNKLENLRIVTHQQNQWNRTKAKGFSWNKVAEKWQAQIKVNSKDKHLGYFNSEAEAREAYLKAKQIFHII